MGKLGLCKPGGSGMMLTVRNNLDAKPGERVSLGIDRHVRVKGFFFAYILPLMIFLFSAVLGYILSRTSGINGLDVIAGFCSLTLSLIYSFKKMVSMDKTKKLCIKRGLHDVPVFYG